jgi:hypothetical protein
MMLNTDPHFMAAKGYRSYAAASRAAKRVSDALPLGNRPMMIITTRYFDGGRIDFVVVAPLGQQLEYLAQHLASNNIYTVNPK